MNFLDSLKSGARTFKTGVAKGIKPMNDKGIIGKVPQRKPNKAMNGLELLIKATKPKA